MRESECRLMCYADTLFFHPTLVSLLFHIDLLHFPLRRYDIPISCLCIVLNLIFAVRCDPRFTSTSYIISLPSLSSLYSV